MSPESADFEGLLRAFLSHGVRFVVVGGVSAALQGVPAVTYDLDLVLDPDPANLDRAAELLRDLEACDREHLPRRLLPERADLETPGAKLLMTRLGPVDILGRLATGWGFGELASRVRAVQLPGDRELLVLDLGPLIEVKERVGREKDRAVLPLYRRTLAERERGGR
jgi:hypothetical protein